MDIKFPIESTIYNILILLVFVFELCSVGKTAVLLRLFRIIGVLCRDKDVPKWHSVAGWGMLNMCQIGTLFLSMIAKQSGMEGVMAATLPRITARVDEQTQELLAQAALLSGMTSINSFVLSAAIEKAKQVLEREYSLKLSQQDAERLVAALDAPAKPHARLRQAVADYQAKSTS